MEPDMRDPVGELYDAISIDVPLRAVTPSGHRVKFVAEGLVLEKIARVFKLAALESFSARAELFPWRRDGVQLDGEISARLTQSCIVSLKPVDEEIAVSFHLRLVAEGSKLAVQLAQSREEETFSLDSDDIPDVFSGETLDLGAIFMEQLSLAIDPFPRAEGEEFTEMAVKTDVLEDHKENPFAVLQSLKTKQ